MSGVGAGLDAMPRRARAVVAALGAKAASVVLADAVALTVAVLAAAARTLARPATAVVIRS